MDRCGYLVRVWLSTALHAHRAFVATWLAYRYTHATTVSLVDEIPFYPGTVVGYGHLSGYGLLFGDLLINSAPVILLLDQGPWAYGTDPSPAVTLGERGNRVADLPAALSQREFCIAPFASDTLCDRRVTHFVPKAQQRLCDRTRRGLVHSTVVWPGPVAVWYPLRWFQARRGLEDRDRLPGLSLLGNLTSTSTLSTLLVHWVERCI